MTRSRPWLALVSRVLVALWIGVHLASRVVEPAPTTEADPESATARVQPRPVAPPQQPVAPAPSRPAPLPEPTSLGAAEVAEGDRILASGGDFPVLSCSYEDFPSFESYARAMGGIGARFVVVQRRRIVASIDPLSGRLGEPSVSGAFSPRARDYTGEPALAPLARAARERFGSDAVVMMLVPRSVDAGLFGGIARALAGRGDAHGSYREIRGRYQRGPGGGVLLRVDRGTRLDGSEVAMDLLFDLAERPSA